MAPIKIRKCVVFVDVLRFKCILMSEPEENEKKTETEK